VSEYLLWPDDDDDDDYEGTPAWQLDRMLPQVPAWPRMWNWWLGGKDHYPVDRQAAQACAAVYPGIGTLARSCQYFTARAVRYLAGEAGIRQFIEIGTGLLVHDPVHQLTPPGSRVIYTAGDPEVIALGRGMLDSAPGVETCYIQGALDDPGDLLTQALDALDPARPAAVLLMQELGHFGDPARGGSGFAKVIVQGLTKLLPAGSYLAISEITTCDPALTAALADFSQAAGIRYHPRDPAQVTSLFDGLRLIDPGVVPISQWRPDPSPFTPPPVPAWGGIGTAR
jgi:S-adenosyl methyltransferase